MLLTRHSGRLRAAVVITLVLGTFLAAQERTERRSVTASQENPVVHDATSIAAGAVVTAPKAAAECVGAVTATGNSIGQNLARDAARIHWKNQVAINYGGEYETWNNSKSQTSSCRRRGFGNWTCDVTAEPCRAGGTTTTPGGPACYDHLSVTGSNALVQTQAENKARQEWQTVAKNTYGDAYMAWSTAQEVSLFCGHNGLGFGQRRWECTARGKPCK